MPILRKYSIALAAILMILSASIVSGQTSYTVSVCSGSAFSFTQPGASGASKYTWAKATIVPANAIVNADAQTIPQNVISQILVNNTAAPATATYAVLNTFDSSRFQLTVTVNPAPVLSNASLSLSVCNGNAFTFTPTSNTGGAVFSWSRAAVNGISNFSQQGTNGINETLNNTIANPVSVSYVYTIAANGCSNSQIMAVTVNPQPTLSNYISGTTTTVCSGTAFTYAPSSLVAGTTYAWSRAIVAGISNVSAQGTGNINETLLNTTTNPVQVNYVYTLTANGCSYNQTIPVTVNPIPVLSNPSTSAAICSGASVTYTPASSYAATTFSWSRAPVNGISPASSTGTGNITEVLTNTTNNPIGVNYIYTLISNGCSNNQTVSVTVQPNPVLNSTLTPASVCSGNNFTYAPASGFAVNSYNWNRAGITAINNGVGSSGTGSINEQLTNTGLTPVNVAYVYNFSYVPANTSITCSNTQIVNVVVNPVLTIGNQTVSSSCSGTTFMLSPNGVPANTLYTWTTPSILSGAISGGSAVSIPQLFIGQALINTGTSIATIQYTVTPSTNGCRGNDFLVTVNVNTNSASNTLSSTLTPPALCSGTNFNYIPASNTGGVSYSWKRFLTTGINNAPATGNGIINEVLVNNTVLPVTVGYAVTLTTADGCANTQTVSVVVNPATQLSSTLYPSAICSNTIFSYAPTSNTAGTSFSWTRAAVSGVTNLNGSGTDNPNETLVDTTNQSITVNYRYHLQTTNGCINDQVVTVVVKPVPTLISTLTPAAICSQSAFSYNPLSNVSGTIFSWTRAIVPSVSNGAGAGTNSISETLVNTSINPISIIYNYTLTANACSTIQPVTLIVNPVPAVRNQYVVICSNTVFSVIPSNVPSHTQYIWTSPLSNPTSAITGTSAQYVLQDSISQQLSNNSTNAATATYTVTPSANGCTGQAFSVIATINPAPYIANQLLTPVCSGTAFIYTPSGVPAGTLLTWTNALQYPRNSLTGASAQPIAQPVLSQVLSSNNYGTDTAVYTVSSVANGCAGTVFTLSVPVKPVPVIGNIVDTICSGSSFLVNLSNLPSNTVYSWANPVSYPFGAIIGGSAQPAFVNAISQNLTNSTNTIAQSVYTITPAINNCTGNTFNVTVIVGVPLAPIANQAVDICSGSSFDVTPINAPQGTTYTWNIPVVSKTGSISGATAAILPQNSVSQQLANSDTVIQTATYAVIPFNTGCRGTAFTATVNVRPLPRAVVSAKPVICYSPLDTLFIRFSGTAPFGFSYADSTGIHTQTNISSNNYLWIIPAWANVSNRNFSIYHLQDFACVNATDTFRFVQKTNPLPLAQIISLHGNYMCDNILDTLLINNLKATDTISTQWTYNGNVVSSTAKDSLFTLQPGRYNALLTNQYGCVDSTANPVLLYLRKRPKVNFGFDSYCINIPIRFTNLSDTAFAGGVQWLWSLGDSTYSNQFSTYNTYTTGGDRHIRLTATPVNCPLSVAWKDTTISIAFPIPAVRMPSVSAYAGENTPISSRSFNLYRYSWQPSWGIDHPDSASVNFNYAKTQEYLVGLIAPSGCITFDTILVRVFDPGVINIFVPKSFTPNGDGVNDILYPYLAGIQDFHFFRVFNRFGNLVFETTNPDYGWNGNYNNVPQNMGVYIWVSEGVDKNGTLLQKRGEVLLLR